MDLWWKSEGFSHSAVVAEVQYFQEFIDPWFRRIKDTLSQY
jgi:hypothetical protein